MQDWRKNVNRVGATGGRSRRGYSLVELTVVAAIMVCVAAVAAPHIVNFVTQSRLLSTLSKTAGTLQQARMQAARMNGIVPVATASTHGGNAVFANYDRDDPAAWDPGEPGFVLANGVTMGASGHPGNATTIPNFTPQPGTGVLPIFNQRGLPCVMNGAMCQNVDASNVQVGYVLYFQIADSFTGPQWGAVTITPAGRIQTWIWNGSAYIAQ